METSYLYASMDQDSIIKFWKSRPFYNEDEDEFYGTPAELSPSILSDARAFADAHLEMGDCIPIIIAKSKYCGPYFSRMLTYLEDYDDEAVAGLLELGFRQVALSLGKEDNERYGDCLGLDVSPFQSRIIRSSDEGIVANEMITDVLADEEAERSCEDGFLYFLVKTESMFGVSEKYMNIHEIIENNPNQYFDLLSLLTTLEKYVLFEDETDSLDIKIKQQELAMKMSSLGFCYDADIDSDALHELCSMLSRQFGIQVNEEFPGMIKRYVPKGRHYFGIINEATPVKSEANRYSVIGKRDGKNKLHWWITIDSYSSWPLPTPITFLETNNSLFAPVTGVKTNHKPTPYLGSNFYSEIHSEFDKYIKELRIRNNDLKSTLESLLIH